MNEELTSKLHSEFSISSETEISHKVQAACSVVKKGVFELEEALEMYGITKYDYDKYSPKWLKLIS